MSDEKPEQKMSELDHVRYAAFKRGVGWRVQNPDNTGFHAAALEYVQGCRDEDAAAVKGRELLGAPVPEKKK